MNVLDRVSGGDRMAIDRSPNARYRTCWRARLGCYSPTRNRQIRAAVGLTTNDSHHDAHPVPRLAAACARPAEGGELPRRGAAGTGRCSSWPVAVCVRFRRERGRPAENHLLFRTCPCAGARAPFGITRGPPSRRCTQEARAVTPLLTRLLARLSLPYSFGSSTACVARRLMAR